VYNWVNRQLAIIIYFFGMGAGLFISPHCPTLTTFFVTGYFIGYFVGAYDAAQVVWMMEIWQSKAGPFIQAQHFCYALGSNLPPLLLGPFLVNKDDDEEDAIDVGISTTDISIASSTMEAEKESKIFIPFTIGGAYCCLSALVQIFLFTFYRYHTPPVEEDLDSDNNIVPAVETQDTIVTSEEKAGFFKNVNWSKVKMIVFSAMFYGGYQGMEMCSFQVSLSLISETDTTNKMDAMRKNLQLHYRFFFSLYPHLGSTAISSFPSQMQRSY
jgi:MFS family permease